MQDSYSRLIPALGVATACACAAWIYTDYRAWLSLGPGGLPSTPLGWARMTRLRLRMRDPLNLSLVRKQIGSPGDMETLAGLEPRRGDRPVVAPHPVPHRQRSDHAPAAVKYALQGAFDAEVKAWPNELVYHLSHYEKQSRAVMLCSLDQSPGHACAAHGEVGHIHPSDGSMHMVLSPSDCCRVVELGWGEQHGLAGVAYDLPLTYTMVYAPRSDADIAAIARILRGASTYMIGHKPAFESPSGASNRHPV